METPTRFKTIADILNEYKVNSFKSLDDGIAIRKGGYWLYFCMGKDGYYRLTGSTFRLQWH